MVCGKCVIIRYNDENSVNNVLIEMSSNLQFISDNIIIVTDNGFIHKMVQSVFLSFFPNM